MDFFKKIAEKKKEAQKTDFEKNNEERVKIKKSIEQTLNNLKFKDFEKEEVFAIIDLAQDKIEKIKSTLIGTNINNDPT